MPGDIDILRDRLRTDTAKMLGVDLENITAAQSVRLSRACMLRLEVDDIESRKLAGETIDMARFLLASKELEAMFGGASDASGQSYDFSGAREELMQLLSRRAEAIRQREESLLRRESEQPKPSSDAPGDVESSPTAPVDAPAGPQPDPPPETIYERMRRINAQRPPAHYLKLGQRRDPWDA